MPRGGKRQGTQGKAYSNRTDLAVDYSSKGNPATGGINPPANQTPLMPMVTADQVPNIYDPSPDPSAPITSGLDVGPGPGSNALPPMPPAASDPVRQVIQALLLKTQNPDLVRILNRLDYEGR